MESISGMSADDVHCMPRDLVDKRVEIEAAAWFSHSDSMSVCVCEWVLGFFVHNLSHSTKYCHTLTV